MNQTNKFNLPMRESDDWDISLQQDEEMSDALRDAILATRQKIDSAFSGQTKFTVRLKDVRA